MILQRNRISSSPGNLKIWLKAVYLWGPSSLLCKLEIRLLSIMQPNSSINKTELFVLLITLHSRQNIKYCRLSKKIFKLATLEEFTIFTTSPFVEKNARDTIWCYRRPNAVLTNWVNCSKKIFKCAEKYLTPTVEHRLVLEIWSSKRIPHEINEID